MNFKKSKRKKILPQFDRLLEKKIKNGYASPPFGKVMVVSTVAERTEDGSIAPNGFIFVKADTAVPLNKTEKHHEKNLPAQ